MFKHRTSRAEQRQALRKDLIISHYSNLRSKLFFFKVTIKELEVMLMRQLTVFLKVQNLFNTNQVMKKLPLQALHLINSNEAIKRFFKQ